MTKSALEVMLTAWGLALARTAGGGGSCMGTQTHPLDRARQFAPGKRSAVVKRLATDRTGFDRRRAMADAANAGLESGKTTGIRIVPGWACDPVAGSETKPQFGGRAPEALPKEIALIDRHARELLVADELRGRVLRVQYTMSGNTTEKAALVSLQMGEEIGTRRYREALAGAHGWMEHALFTE